MPRPEDHDPDTILWDDQVESLIYGFWTEPDQNYGDPQELGLFDHEDYADPGGEYRTKWHHRNKRIGALKGLFFRIGTNDNH
jgi:hypothetical protein